MKEDDDLKQKVLNSVEQQLKEEKNLIGRQPYFRLP